MRASCRVSRGCPFKESARNPSYRFALPPSHVAPAILAIYVELDTACAAPRYVRTDFCHPNQPAFCTRARGSRSTLPCLRPGTIRGAWRFTTPRTRFGQTVKAMGRRLSLRELPRIGPLTSPSSIGASSPSSQRIDARFLSTETAGTALSVKKSDREDDPRCLPSIGARASERGCDAAPFLSEGISRRTLRSVATGARLSIRTFDPAVVTSPRWLDRPSRVAESAGPTPCDACPGCHPPPSPRPHRTGHRPRERRRTRCFSGPRRHYRSLQLHSMHGHAHELSTLFSARPSPLSALMKSRAVCRSPPRAPRGERRRLSEPWALACGRRREKRGAPVLRREQHG